jgi:hypothetical protein
VAVSALIGVNEQIAAAKVNNRGRLMSVLSGEVKDRGRETTGFLTELVHPRQHSPGAFRDSRTTSAFGLEGGMCERRCRILDSWSFSLGKIVLYDFITDDSKID